MIVTVVCKHCKEASQLDTGGVELHSILWTCPECLRPNNTSLKAHTTKKPARSNGDEKQPETE